VSNWIETAALEKEEAGKFKISPAEMFWQNRP
jgi:hypothetical protein